MKDFDSTTHPVRSESPRRSADASAPSATEVQGPSYWRSLEELAESPSFAETLQREFPRQAAELGNLDRRRFLQLTGASLGLAGMTACTKQPAEKVIPYVRQPEEIIPGKALFFATAISRAGYAAPVLAESHMGRPTKLEGNPEHPASRGATDAITQAAILDLYDPDRSRAITHLGQIRSWDTLVTQIEGLRSALQSLGGEGLAIVTGNETSPTLARLLGELAEEMPSAKHYVFEPAAGNFAEAARMATGGDAAVRYDFAAADVVLAVESDFLHEGPSAVRHAKEFRSRRKAHTLDDARNMSRLYVAESAPSGTSTVADHRLALRPTAVGHFLVALAAQLGVAGASRPSGLDERATAWVEEVAADLRANAGSSLVVVGEYASAELQALGLAINQALGNMGTTVEMIESPSIAGAPFEEFLADAEAGRLSTVFFLGVNPVYASTADQDVIAAMDRVPLRFHLGAFVDETGERCHWHVPQSHDLESWGDLRTPDGTATVVQPLIQPLYDSHTSIEVVAALLGRSQAPQIELVRETWSQGNADAAFEKSWRRWLHDGIVPDSRSAAASASADGSAAASALGRATTDSDLELIFRPDPTVYDGRYANNGWLQECPKPITKLTWDNSLQMSPKTAADKGLGDLLPGNEQLPDRPMVKLEVGSRSVEVPVWVVPGMADDTLLLHIGYGRSWKGAVAGGAGFDVNTVRAADTGVWHATEGVGFSRTGDTYLLACTQDHHSMEGRDLVRTSNVQTFEAHPDNPLGIHHHFDVSKSLMPGDDYPYDGYRWGMSIDLGSCTGCNACLVACVSENNIPVVGKDQVGRGREMHWIRLDRYFVGDDPNEVETVVNQPIPCMQCEQAPCEVVCPVAATVHSDEGLNDMVYNRCVGTRYCSNNCPYKVRRFNFLLYQDFETPQLKLGRNPDVTVRSRGVMEKCTYCVQRINQARIAARREHELIPTDSVQSACQQVCPSDAIIFGDIGDAQAAVTHAKNSAADYSLLAELGTRPRTTYLGRISNPNPALWERLYPNRPLVADREHHGDGHHGSDSHGVEEHGHGTAEGYGTPESHSSADDHGSDAAPEAAH